MKQEDLRDFEEEMARLRAKWPSGPWDKEPDRVEWKSETGYPCLVKRNTLGAWCGYVGLPPGHAMHGKDYGEVYDAAPIDVHGRMTYSDKCQEAICHVPAPGEPDDVWWIGFDCAHGGDQVPGMMYFESEYHRSTGRGALLSRGQKYRTIHYAKRETESLAQQLKELACAPPSSSSSSS